MSVRNVGVLGVDAIAGDDDEVAVSGDRKLGDSELAPL